MRSRSMPVADWCVPSGLNPPPPPRSALSDEASCTACKGESEVIESPNRMRDTISSCGRPGSCRASRSEEHTSELQSLMRISYAVFCLKKKIKNQITNVISRRPQLHIRHKTVSREGQKSKPQT